ncbi:hypothetical protein VTN96DRAFT_6971 [Rasamsonia emersonii]
MKTDAIFSLAAAFFFATAAAIIPTLPPTAENMEAHEPNPMAKNLECIRKCDMLALQRLLAAQVLNLAIGKEKGH